MAGLAAPWAEEGVVAGDPLGSIEDRLADDRGHRDLDPFLWGPQLVAGALAAGRRRHSLVAVVAGASFVGWIRQHAADACDRPGLVAGRARNPVLVEAPTDAPHGTAACHEVVEDAPNHDGLRLVDLQVAGACWPSGYTPEAIGDQAVHDLPGPRPKEPPPTVAFRYLRALIFCDHPLNLDQQGRLRVIVERGSIQVENPDAVPGQLVRDQDLVGIAASETVWREAPDLFEQAGFGGVTERVETGTVEPGPGVAIVCVLTDDLVPELRHLPAQGLQLRADGATGFLGFRRDASVDGDSHLAVSSKVRSGNADVAVSRA
jgi:hypothetical protein